MQSVAVLVACVYVFVASAVQNSGRYLYGGRNVTITLRQDQLTIKCGSEYQVPSKSILNVKTVKIEMCPPPAKAYIAELEALKVNKSSIEELDLNEVDTILEAKHFKGLNIMKLRINNNYNDRILMLGKNTFEHLSNLTVLNLKKVQLRPLSNTSKVQHIEVDSGNVYDDVLSGCKDLRELHLSNIELSTNRVLVPSHWLEQCTNLQILRVSLIKSSLLFESLTNMLEGAKNLKELALTVCELKTLPWDSLNQAEHLSRLILSQNDLLGIELRNFKINSLNYLDLSDCHIQVLKGLPVSHAKDLEIDLYKNYLLDVQLEEEDYQMLRNNNMKVNVKRAHVRIDCYDCKHGWLWQAVREERFFIDAQCKQDVKLGDGELQVRDLAECSEDYCSEAPACRCRHIWSSGAKWAHCENAELRILPQEPGLQKIFASGNRIEKINAEDLPESLLYLDLSNNSVSLVDVTVAEKLFSVRERHVRLAGNPITCVCDNKRLLDVLYDNRNQVDDYENITCRTGEFAGKPISQPVDLLVCNSFFPVKLSSALAVLLAICLLLIALYCQYSLPIKVFLFSWGWCIRCVREEELDGDRRFDAFVSFCHEDAEIVMQHLVPGLEHSPHAYKLCLHYRDWFPGELISTQIKLSVALSRRTIIVLSRNFVKSNWGLAEFRAAHISTLREGRVRVIVIVLDDVVDDENLDSELWGYLRANTYVRWGDPWFWDKLRYALPHRVTERIV